MSVPQDLFAAALLDPARPVPRGLGDGRDGRDGPARRRFDVYRNNVAVSLTEALQTGFPVITRLLGKPNMDGLAGIFLRAHPPRSPLMMLYGEDFPAFLAGMEQLAHLGYLADVARLELALRQSYHAADADPVAPDALARMNPDQLLRSHVSFAPALRLLRSDWPIHDIWRFNTEDGAPPPRVQAQDVLVTRPEFDPIPHLLPAGGGDWIAALQQGMTIGAAHDAALSAAPGFDLGAVLALLLQGDAITSLDPET